MAITRHDEVKSTQQPPAPAEEAALERTAQTATIDCFVALDPTRGPRYPCTSVPLLQHSGGSGDSYSIVITVKGVLFKAATDHNIVLECLDYNGFINLSEPDGRQPDADLHVELSGTTAEGPQLEPISCVIRQEGADAIRAMQVPMALDPTKRF